MTNLAKKMENLKIQLQQTMKAMEAICGPDARSDGVQLNKEDQEMQED